MDKGGKDPKVLAQAAKHFEKFFTSEVRRGCLQKRAKFIGGYTFEMSLSYAHESFSELSGWMDHFEIKIEI